MHMPEFVRTKQLNRHTYYVLSKHLLSQLLWVLTRKLPCLLSNHTHFIWKKPSLRNISFWYIASGKDKDNFFFYIIHKHRKRRVPKKPINRSPKNYLKTLPLINLATISYLLIDSLYHSRHTKVSENSFSEQYYKFQTCLSCQKEAWFVEIISFVFQFILWFILIMPIHWHYQMRRLKLIY